ncbi:MAG: hypothetical protein JXB10_16730 [Pirellulales bacterium]|nr:hypothetical protein [Pirellulales bacterium]
MKRFPFSLNRRFFKLWALLLLFPCCAVGARCESSSPPPSGHPGTPAASMKAWRKPAADRQRRIIYNNDGNEAVIHMTRPSVEDFLKCRTTGLAGTQVDSIFYCTADGFGTFKHLTKVGQLFTVRMEPHPDNQLQAMAEQGLDPLKIMTDFGKQQEMEIFWSFRMNDIHDHKPAGLSRARFLFNKLKNEHPEYLMGTPKNRPQYGAWSAVDYGRREIRDWALRFVEEICRNYDVDGVELDFFRHPVFFRSTTQGRPATDEELAKMTELLRRIRALADEVGKKRGRPILIAVRVPDSVEYCRAIGLDIEGWMADDLIDLLIVSGYFQLNDWDNSVALAHKYGVKVYPSLDESRIRDNLAKDMRSTNLAYRGRAANVWSAGADGVYLFNAFDLKTFGPTSPIWRELGNPKVLTKLDKDYFASVRGIVPANGGNLPYRTFQEYETLNPSNPKIVAPGKKAAAHIRLGEDFTKTQPKTLKLRLRFADPPKADAIRVSLNGRAVKLQPEGTEWLEAEPQPADLREGVNEVEVALSNDATKTKWTDLMLEVRH